MDAFAPPTGIPVRLSASALGAEPRSLRRPSPQHRDVCLRRRAEQKHHAFSTARGGKLRAGNPRPAAGHLLPNMRQEANILAEKAAFTQRAIPISSPTEWKEALSSIPHCFFHTWEHSYAMHLTHRLPSFLYCAEAGGIRVVCPFIERPLGDAVDIATPYGFSGFTGNGAIPDLPEHWREFSAERNYVSVFLNLHPLFCRAQHTDPATLFEQKELYILDTRPEIEALLESCTRARRRELRQWSAEAAVYTDRERLNEFVLAQYREFYRLKNATDAYSFSLETMEFLLGQDNLLLLGAGSGTGLEAVNVFAVTADGAEGLFHFSRAGGKRHSAGLMWEALLETRRRGIPFFNLGGGLSRNDSLAQFKSRFGAAPRMSYAIKQVIDAERYSAFCARRRINPHDRDGYFPAYRMQAPR